MLSPLVFLSAESLGIQSLCDVSQRITFKIELEHPADDIRFFGINDQFLGRLINIVANAWQSSDPFAPFSGGTHLIFGPFGDHFTLELGERKEDIEGQPPHGSVSVEMLRD